MADRVEVEKVLLTLYTIHSVRIRLLNTSKNFGSLLIGGLGANYHGKVIGKEIFEIPREILKIFQNLQNYIKESDNFDKIFAV